MLATYQTAHERNISLVSCAGLHAVWLRTCYDPDLAEKYEEMKRESAVPGLAASGNKILDDPSRYDFEDGSNIQHISGQDDEEMVAEAQESEEQWRELSLAQLRIQAGLYLLDREAIESGLIKILWLDEHGQIS